MQFAVSVIRIIRNIGINESVLGINFTAEFIILNINNKHRNIFIFSFFSVCWTCRFLLVNILLLTSMTDGLNIRCILCHCPSLTLAVWTIWLLAIFTLTTPSNISTARKSEPRPPPGLYSITAFGVIVLNSICHLIEISNFSIGYNLRKFVFDSTRDTPATGSRVYLR